MRALSSTLALVTALAAAAAQGQSPSYSALDRSMLAQTPPQVSLGTEVSGGSAWTTVPVAQTIPAGQSYSEPVNRGAPAYVAATSAYYAPPTSRPMVAGSGAEASGRGPSPYKTMGSTRVASNTSAPGSVVDQMLQEGGGNSAYASLSSGPQPMSAAPVGSRYAAPAPGGSYGACNSCNTGVAPCSDGCWQSAGFGECCPASPWFAAVDAVYMTRSKANEVITSVDALNPYNVLMTTGQDLPWRVGGEVRFGRRFCGDAFAVEGVYWTIDNFGGDWSATNVNGVKTPLDVYQIEFAGVNGLAYFDDVQEHLLHRSDDMHNGELNFVFNPTACSAGCGTHMNWSLGLRYFRFNEDLTLTSGYGFGPVTRATLGENVHNQLFGGQAGFDMGLQVLPRWVVFLNAKVGAFNNQMDTTFSALRGDGVAANPTVDSGATGTYPVYASKNAVSLLSELRAGVHIKFGPNIGGEVGYRVMGVTGLALADHQIPIDLADFGQLRSVKNNGNLLLHGGFAGLTFSF